jgi:hypothetical protein
MGSTGASGLRPPKDLRNWAWFSHLLSVNCKLELLETTDGNKRIRLLSLSSLLREFCRSFDRSTNAIRQMGESIHFDAQTCAGESRCPFKLPQAASAQVQAQDSTSSQLNTSFKKEKVPVKLFKSGFLKT